MGMESHGEKSSGRPGLGAQGGVANPASRRPRPLFLFSPNDGARSTAHNAATHSSLWPVLRALSCTAAAISRRSSSTTVGNVTAAKATAMALEDLASPESTNRKYSDLWSPSTSRGRGGTSTCVIAQMDDKNDSSSYVTARPIRRELCSGGGTSRDPACSAQRTRPGHVSVLDPELGPRPSAGRGAAVPGLFGALAPGAGRRPGAGGGDAAIPSRAARRGLGSAAAAGR